METIVWECYRLKEPVAVPVGVAWISAGLVYMCFISSSLRVSHHMCFTSVFVEVEIVCVYISGLFYDAAVISHCRMTAEDDLKGYRRELSSPNLGVIPVFAYPASQKTI
jgi:cobalamin biosynthesis protein CobD/CbiB